MTRSRVTIVALVICLSAALAPCQQSLTEHPGYFDLERLDLFAPGELEADIDVAGAALALMAGATAAEDPQFSELMSQIQRIRVQVGTVASPEQAAVTLADAIGTLETSGWSRLLRVSTDGTEQVHMLGMGDATALSGIAVLIFDGEEEAVLVNIVGDLDPQVVGRLLGSVGDLDLEQLGVELAAGSGTTAD